MCLLAILWRVADDAPLIVAANREEAFARGGTPPQLHSDRVRFVSGLDPQAGGTWFGVNQHGVLVAVTNRKAGSMPTKPRSRGLLVRDLLQSPSAKEAAATALQQLSKNNYAPCNLFFADAQEASIIHAGGWLRHRPLSPGIHILTAGELNDATDARAMFALEWLHNQSASNAKDWLQHLKTLCGYRSNDGGPSICLHAEKGGTVSSSIVLLRNSLATSQYWHSQGSPDRHPYQNCSLLLHQMV